MSRKLNLDPVAAFQRFSDKLQEADAAFKAQVAETPRPQMVKQRKVMAQPKPESEAPGRDFSIFWLVFGTLAVFILMTVMAGAYIASLGGSW
jgi:hypothetical protein